MKLKLAFMGFRHGHIFDVYNRAKDHPEIEIVAACEEHEETRQQLIDTGRVDVTHNTFDKLLEVESDAIAVGDYYAKRGPILIEAMKNGRHVISDKPICTELSELDEIESLTREKNLVVGCQLDMRSSPNFSKLRDLILSGTIGEVHAISFNGQHPLSYGSRPQWYFEEGKHGGTINDIGIHAIDFIPWATGLKFSRIDAARNWNAYLPEVPFFKDSAQMMLTMDNGCGVLGDVSYLTPDAAGYSLPQYWRTTVWGNKGMLETSATATGLDLYSKDVKECQSIQTATPETGAYLNAFIQEIAGETDLHITSNEVLKASRISLQIQEAADSNRTAVAL